jgi:uncharacterized membrane protein YedE/YeeE
MRNLLRSGRWSPYVVGGAIGVLSWITFAAMHKSLGASTSFVQVAGALEGLVAPEHVTGNEYYEKTLLGTAEKPAFIVDWQLALVVMLGIGAFAAARSATSRFVEHVPRLWEWRFGSSRPLRYAAAFAGGAVMLYGARMAGGCTSGHAVSGGLQLAVSSWTFLAAMFASGVFAAFALYGAKGRSHV